MKNYNLTGIVGQLIHLFSYQIYYINFIPIFVLLFYLHLPISNIGAIFVKSEKNCSCCINIIEVERMLIYFSIEAKVIKIENIFSYVRYYLSLDPKIKIYRFCSLEIEFTNYIGSKVRTFALLETFFIDVEKKHKTLARMELIFPYCQSNKLILLESPTKHFSLDLHQNILLIGNLLPSLLASIILTCEWQQLHFINVKIPYCASDYTLYDIYDEISKRKHKSSFNKINFDPKFFVINFKEEDSKLLPFLLANGSSVNIYIILQSKKIIFYNLFDYILLSESFNIKIILEEKSIILKESLEIKLNPICLSPIISTINSFKENLAFATKTIKNTSKPVECILHKPNSLFKKYITMVYYDENEFKNIYKYFYLK